MSVLMPGGNGTMIVTGRVGQGSAAKARSAASAGQVASTQSVVSKQATARIIELSLVVEHRHRHAFLDGADARVLAALLLLAELQHPHDVGARHEHHAGVVGDDEVAGIDADVAHLDLTVDL